KPGYLVFSFDLQRYQPSMESIKELHQQTGAGLLTCKLALIDANGNLELAIENMRNKGNA
ncbi:ubiquitin, partial [Listeria monocytogenes]